MYENRIKHLEEMHRILNDKIDTLEKTGKFGDNQIQEMKKQRLRFRDELAILRRKQWEHDHETLRYDDDER
jgi:uncharacterized protein YdcH (DUF465 family)